MKSFCLPLLVAVLIPFTLTHAAGPRVLIKDDRVIILGGKAPTAVKFNVAAKAGETVTISISEGSDNTGDQGVSWHLDSLGGDVLAKGFTKERKTVSWTVKLITSNPVLIVEDRDTNRNGMKQGGNAIKVGVVASGLPVAAPQPAPKGKYDNYFGGPRAWYDSGYQLGKADRKAKKSADLKRHSDHFDEITAGEFRRGYMDAFK